MSVEDRLPTALKAGISTVHVLLAALKARDHETERHSDRVIRLALALGRACGLTEDELFCLKCGAALHDIGKIGVPDRILNFPGPLRGDDWTAMQAHPVVGDQILRAAGLEAFEPICRIVRHHHENFDGSGYPDGLSGEDVPAMARMVHLADAYDAMVSDRPYRTGMNGRKAAGMLNEEAGVRSDPWLVRRFTLLFDRNPAIGD